MKLSVIIPTLNEEASIGSVLERLLAAPGVHEVVVSDGGSMDGTVGLVAPPARVLKGRPGRGPQLRRGAEAATGDVLLFLHADVLPPGDVAAQVSGALRAGFVGGNFRLRYPGGGLLGRWLELLAPAYRRIPRYYGDSGIFVRRDVYEACGGFPYTPIMEDVVLRPTDGTRGTNGLPARPHGQRLPPLEGPADQNTPALGFYADRIRPRRDALEPGTLLPGDEGLSFRILVMAKAPIPGTVKTRLHLPPEDAARLQRAFITDTVDKARSLAPTTVAGAPADRPGLIRTLLPENVPLIPQPNGDLGERMLAAVRTLFDDAPDPVIILGTDSPTLPPDSIAKAASSLYTHGISIIPSEDGGYVLLGLSEPYEAVLSGIGWSTPAVYGRTLLRAEEAGLPVYEGAPWFDVDEPEDLAARPDLAPGTAEVLRLL